MLDLNAVADGKASLPHNPPNNPSSSPSNPCAGTMDVLYISNADQSRKFLHCGRPALERALLDGQKDVVLISTSLVSLVHAAGDARRRVVCLAECTHENECEMPHRERDSHWREAGALRALRQCELRRNADAHMSDECRLYGPGFDVRLDRGWCLSELQRRLQP